MNEIWFTMVEGGDYIVCKISNLLSSELGGAILGAVISAVFAASWKSIIYIFYKRSALNVLEHLGNDTRKAIIVIRKMDSVRRDYFSFNPKYHPNLSQEVRTWTNIDAVFGYEDVLALSEITNLLGTVSKTNHIAIQDVNEAWSNWTDPIICIGGNYKVDEIFRNCSPKLVDMNHQRIKLLGSNKEHRNDGVYDSGIIYKGKTDNGEICITITGLGGLTTVTGSKFLLRNIKALGKLYGNAGFAIVVRSRLQAGNQLYEIVDIQEKPKTLRRIIYLFTWLKWRKYF